MLIQCYKKATFYETLRQGGNAVFFLSLSLSLAADFGTGLLFVYLASCVLVSNFRSIPESVGNFDAAFSKSRCGLTYLSVIAYLGVGAFLVFYHSDSTSEIETAVKRFALAYVIFNYLNDYSVRVVFWAAATAALLAFLTALHDIYWLDLPRAAGHTNSIRFGMLAILLSVISLIALLSSSRSQAKLLFFSAAAFGGLAGGIFSGSRGALLAIPFMLMPLIWRAWSRRKRGELAVLAAYALMTVSLVTVDLGSMHMRFASFVEGIHDMAAKETTLGDQSMALRSKLLQLSLKLFHENPMLGAGDGGWNAEVADHARTAHAGHGFPRFNQAHNQYANDLAKGGLLQGVAGLALLFLPMFLFLRSRPFGEGEHSLAALSGLVTSLGFAAFCLTESVMSLSLPAAIHAILVCYLMAASQSTRVQRTRERRQEQ